MSDQPSQELVEARACVARLQRAQKTLDVSKAKFIGRFKDGKGDRLLGSERTWERMCLDQWEENKPEKWLGRLRQACAQLDGGTPVSVIYREMGFFKRASAHLGELETQINDRRVLVILAATGVGKSVWSRAQVDEERATRCYVRAKPGWKENGISISCGIVEALSGEKNRYIGYDEALDKLKVILAASPKTVFIDEAHEGGIELMKIVRYLVDETQSRFVYLGYPTDYDRVVGANTGALSEARQFLGRSMKPIFSDYRTGTRTDDVALVLKKSGISSEANALAQKITPWLKVAEGLRTLDDALELARQWDDEGEVEMGAQSVEDALAQVSGIPEQSKKGRKLQESLEKEAA